MISVFLRLRSSSVVKVNFDFGIKDFVEKTAGVVDNSSGCFNTFNVRRKMWGRSGFVQRTNALALFSMGP